jgi:hypothetical protein
MLEHLLTKMKVSEEEFKAGQIGGQPRNSGGCNKPQLVHIDYIGTILKQVGGESPGVC